MSSKEDPKSPRINKECDLSETTISELKELSSSKDTLVKLNLSKCTQIPSEEFQLLREFKNLIACNLQGTNIYDVSVLLPSKKSIKELNIDGCKLLDDEKLKVLEDFPYVRLLNS